MLHPWKICLVAVAALALTLPAVPLAAQDDRPASPRGQASTQVGGEWVEQDGRTRYQGGKWIDIDYGRPILRGRDDIFGSGEDYGQGVLAGAPVWRVGANQTTRLSTEAALTIGGKTIEPGEYSLFVDLGQGESGPEWTLIVSSQPYQQSFSRDEEVATWGAYRYDPEHDVVRAPMEVSPTEHSLDQFTIVFLDVTDEGGAIAMGWAETLATVPFGLGGGE